MKGSLTSYIPIGPEVLRAQRTISRAGLILFAGILLGVWIPGVLYEFCGTFYRDDIALRLPDNPKLRPNPKPTWEAYEKAMDGLKDSVTSINARIGSEGDFARLPVSALAVNDISALVEQRTKLQTALDNMVANPPFHLSGFYLDSLMLACPAFYTCLAWLIFLLAPNYTPRPEIRRWIPIFIGTYLLYRWPTWMRNIPPLRYIERHVYASGNWDISIGSFFVQESLAFVICILLISVWAIWAEFMPVWQERVRKCLWTDANGDGVAKFAEGLVKLFVHWQICSIVLAAAFVPYTFFYWNYVIEFGDRRYLAQAIIMHGLWGVTWLLISLPLAWTWYEWNVCHRLRAKIAEAPLGLRGPRPIEIEMGSLVGSWNLVGSIAGAVVAFGFPVVKGILTHF